MNQTPDTPNDLKPLRLVPGYRISDDGRVFKANGKPVKPLTLLEARRFATGDITFDGNRLSRQPLGPVEPESLVYMGEEEILHHDDTREIRAVQMVQSVRLQSTAEKAAEARGETVSWFSGGPMPAVGDTETGWYRLDHDGAKVLFHGPSVAASEKSSWIA